MKDGRRRRVGEQSGDVNETPDMLAHEWRCW
jgi:hypothetical protein